MNGLSRGLVCLVMLLFMLLPAGVAAQETALVIPAGQVVKGDVTTLSRAIMVAGVVEGDVTSASGSIVVEGLVQGDVVSYSGLIQIRAGGRVGGHILSLTGGVIRDETAQVAGRLLGGELQGAAATAALGLPLHGRPAPATGPFSSLLAGAALALSGLVLGTAGAALWPRRLHGVSRTLRALPGRALLLGLLTVLLLSLGLGLATALLALSLVGLPLVPLLWLIIHVPVIYGFSGLALALSEHIGLAGGRATAIQTGLGLLLLIMPLLAGYLLAPLAVLMLFYLLAGAGLGAVILSRGGAYAPVANL